MRTMECIKWQLAFLGAENLGMPLQDFTETKPTSEEPAHKESVHIVSK